MRPYLILYTGIPAGPRPRRRGGHTGPRGGTAALALLAVGTAPTWVLLLSPLLLGAPHLASDLRWLVLSPPTPNARGLGWWLLLTLGAMTVVRQTGLVGAEHRAAVELSLGLIATAGALLALRDAVYVYRHTKPSAAKAPAMSRFTLVCGKAQATDVAAGLQRGAAIAAGVTLARSECRRRGAVSTSFPETIRSPCSAARLKR